MHCNEIFVLMSITLKCPPIFSLQWKWFFKLRSNIYNWTPTLFSLSAFFLTRSFSFCCLQNSRKGLSWTLNLVLFSFSQSPILSIKSFCTCKSNGVKKTTYNEVNVMNNEVNVKTLTNWMWIFFLFLDSIKRLHLRSNNRMLCIFCWKFEFSHNSF